MSSEKASPPSQVLPPVAVQKAKSRKHTTAKVVAASVLLSVCALAGQSVFADWADDREMSRQMLVKGSCPKQVDPLNVGHDWVSTRPLSKTERDKSTLGHRLLMLILPCCPPVACRTLLRTTSTLPSPLTVSHERVSLA